MTILSYAQTLTGNQHSLLYTPELNKKFSCCRETALCSVSLKLLLSHSRSLNVF